MEHINIQQPDFELCRKTLSLAAAETVKFQCGWEYGFASENEKTRATFRITYQWTGRFTNK